MVPFPSQGPVSLPHFSCGALFKITEQEGFTIAGRSLLGALGRGSFQIIRKKKGMCISLCWAVFLYWPVSLCPLSVLPARKKNKLQGLSMFSGIRDGSSTEASRPVSRILPEYRLGLSSGWLCHDCSSSS